MWICPKCGRAFKNANQQHYCGSAPRTVEEYIQRQDSEIQPYLARLHKTIREAIPGASVKIVWSMPTYCKRGSVLSFAAHKKHVGLYAGEEVVRLFAERLSGYAADKGTVRLPYSAPLPEELIGDIARKCCKLYD